ncbi:hypothetical protein [Solirubrobacter deserti]|uniref:Uncharacterized protein n=1 Tax=Solirubrobacter deserti TaxID=2282478 RepID=A0ABT4RJ47_9ACTN|nr:hypothetical protein [Solirubrobacter deserti]MDA0138577.1 hypothetical protein [Solirubrobacter deserti]
MKADVGMVLRQRTRAGWRRNTAGALIGLGGVTAKTATDLTRAWLKARSADDPAAARCYGIFT